MIEETIFSYLTGVPAINTLIGTRLYPFSTVSNPVMPCMQYRKISAVREHDLTGSRNTSWSRYQFDCFGDTYAQAKQVSDALRVAFDGYISSDILSSKLENEFDAFEDSGEAHRISMDFIVYHNE